MAKGKTIWFKEWRAEKVRLGHLPPLAETEPAITRESKLNDSHARQAVALAELGLPVTAVTPQNDSSPNGRIDAALDELMNR